MSDHQTKAPLWANILGYGGLLPPVSMLAMGYLGPEHLKATNLSYLVIYVALIVSFLGGVTWGYAVSLRPDDVADKSSTGPSGASDFPTIQRQLLIYAVTPMLLGFAVLISRDAYMVYLLPPLLVVMAWRDWRIIDNLGKPKWFGWQRVYLSIGLTLALVLALLAPAGIAR